MVCVTYNYSRASFKLLHTQFRLEGAYKARLPKKNETTNGRRSQFRTRGTLARPSSLPSGSFLVWGCPDLLSCPSSPAHNRSLYTSIADGSIPASPTALYRLYAHNNATHLFDLEDRTERRPIELLLGRQGLEVAAPGGNISVIGGGRFSHWRRTF